MSPSLKDVAASGIRSELLSIAQAHNGVLNPQVVVEAARVPANPLHTYFEWDDSAAAEKFRLAQAEGLIRRVKLTITRASKAPREVSLNITRAFQSRPSQRNAAGGYESLEAILSDEEKRGELVATVTSELRAYRRRFSDLTELADVWGAIDSLDESEGTSARLPMEAPPSA